ncbi:mucin-2-like isoform X3 [Myxocyprinus asiaticus]|uniref:mucin-2-like isoform X3 n=1 Tax=Myxocyprinus asiaticus TaxID=70543 RepID=UPI002223E76B|nr:mucin-2-like isoform X3 [Myxocyprinus asiaticus]
MASPENVGAKKELFYEIECVLDDCDGELTGYKPLSDSDDLEDLAEEEGQREEDIESSEEWEPLMGRSKARRQQHANLLASLPQRRGRPPMHASKLLLNPPTLVAGTAIFPKDTPDAPSLPRQRGRPPKNKSKTSPRPTTYPTLIPKPTPYFTSIYNPTSFSTPIFIQNPTPGINLSLNSMPIPTTDLTPTIKLSPDSTPTTNPALIATLSCKATPTSLLLDGDTSEISNSWKEGGPLEEGVIANEECAAPMKQSPENVKSPMPREAKKLRLSSPPAATPTRRRGRPRKHTSNTTPNFNPITTINSNSNSNPSTTLNPNHIPTTTTSLNPNPTIHSNSNPNTTTTINSNPYLATTFTPNPNPATNSNPNPNLITTSNSNPAAAFNPNPNPTTTTILNPHPKTTTNNFNPYLTTTFTPNPNPTITFNSNPYPTTTTDPNPESSFTTPQADSNSDLDGDSNSDEKGNSGRDEELWEEDVALWQQRLQCEYCHLVDPLISANN